MLAIPRTVPRAMQRFIQDFCMSGVGAALLGCTVDPGRASDKVAWSPKGWPPKAWPESASQSSQLESMRPAPMRDRIPTRAGLGLAGSGLGQSASKRQMAPVAVPFVQLRALWGDHVGQSLGRPSVRVGDLRGRPPPELALPADRARCRTFGSWTATRACRRSSRASRLARETALACDDRAPRRGAAPRRLADRRPLANVPPRSRRGDWWPRPHFRGMPCSRRCAPSRARHPSALLAQAAWRPHSPVKRSVVLCVCVCGCPQGGTGDGPNSVRLRRLGGVRRSRICVPPSGRLEVSSLVRASDPNSPLIEAMCVCRGGGGDFDAGRARPISGVTGEFWREVDQLPSEFDHCQSWGESDQFWVTFGKCGPN